jgi:proteic killer suppression protein
VKAAYRMQVDYEDEDLELLAYESTHITTRWSPSVTKAFRRRIQQLEAVVSEQNLLGLKALHFEELNGGRKGFYSIRIQMQYRLIFRFDPDDCQRLIIIGTEPAHDQQRSDTHGAAAR